MPADGANGTLKLPTTERFTQARVARIIALVVAVGCTGLGVQAFFAALASDQEAPGWRGVLMVLAFGPLAVMVVAGVAGRVDRAAAGAFAVIFPVVLLLWPLATAGRADLTAPEPWIWYLLNVATAATILVFPPALQFAWTVGVPTLYGVVRTLQSGGDLDAVFPTVRQVVYAVILGAVIMTLGWMLRALAAELDRTRAEAVQSYAAAAAADAAEQERVSVAALMHDSVLAALIAAERAHTPRERTLAVSMAREALTRLANTDRDAEEGPDAPVPADTIADGIAAIAAEHGVRITVARDIAPDAPPLPGRIARALLLAGTQALVNAVEHADGVGLTACVRADATRVGVRIQDAGPGFDVDDVPADRLGIRGSIIARVAAVGGRAVVTSSPSGTQVDLTWERTR